MNYDSEVGVELVNKVVGGWRQKTTWEMLDAAASGNASAAPVAAGPTTSIGRAPTALFGSISWSLRRFAAATRSVERQERTGRAKIDAALLDAGFRKWPQDAFNKAQQQLRQLGRERAGMMFQWLLETDLSLKGSHSTPDRARLALETLIFRMAKVEGGKRVNSGQSKTVAISAASR